MTGKYHGGLDNRLGSKTGLLPELRIKFHFPRFPLESSDMDRKMYICLETEIDIYSSSESFYFIENIKNIINIFTNYLKI